MILVPAKGQSSGLAFLFFIACFLGGLPDRSHASVAIDGLELAGDLRERWLAINYYQARRGDRYESEIANADYFVSADGRFDPDEEFQAFRRLIADFQRDGSNAELLCRFPARMTLLAEAVTAPLRRPTCPELEAQFQPKRVRSVSFVFASGYFANPASYYGHTLLKFNLHDEQTAVIDLGAAINYGAATTESPGNPLYVLRGLTGGYPATYSRNDYFLHSYQYTSDQLRDTWEYELALDSRATRFVVEHSWEMQHAKFPYYFFNDNCAHRIVRLIELATTRDLSSTHGFWLLPIQAVRNLDDLIHEETYNPSLLTSFTDKRSALAGRDRRAMVAYFESSADEQINLARSLDTQLLRLHLDYLDLRVALLAMEEQNQSETTALQQQRSVILQELFRRPAQTSASAPETPRIRPSPLRSRPPSKLRAGLHVLDDDTVTTLQYRVANNDLLELRTYGQEASKFIMGDLELRQRDGKLSVERVSLVEVLNLNTKSANLDAAGALSWNLAFDYQRRTPFCGDCRDFGVTAQIGRAARPNDRLLVYGLTGVRLHTQSGPEDEFATAQANVGAVADISPLWKLHLFGSGYLGTTSSETDSVWGIDVAMTVSQRFDARLEARKQGSEDRIGVTFAYYFD